MIEPNPGVGIGIAIGVDCAMCVEHDLDIESDPDIDHKLSLRFLCQSVISGKAGGLICEPLNAVRCGAPTNFIIKVD